MKKVITTIISLCLMLVLAVMIVSCSSVSRNYADKINEFYKNGNALTYEEVVNTLGNECIDVTTNKNGMLVAVKGLNKDNYKEVLQHTDEHTKYEFITITVVTGKCTYAHYAVGTANEVLGGLNITQK